MFSESKQVKENQIKTKISPNNLSKNNKSTKDATKLNNKKKKTIVNEEINKNKKNVEVHEENEKTNTEVIAPVSNKKARLLSLLESSSHRNPINVNQTGNKLRNRMLERLKGMFLLHGTAITKPLINWLNATETIKPLCLAWIHKSS